MFFIFWGKRVARRKLGFAADFCPMCRVPRVFRLNKVKLVAHVYGIPTGSTEGRYERVCQHCKITLDGQPSRYLAMPKRAAALESLIGSTFPTLRQFYARRLEIEERLRSGQTTLADAVRAELIREPFLLLSPSVEARFLRTHLDRVTGIVALVSLVALAALVPFLTGRFPAYGPEITLGFVVAALAAMIGTVAMDGRRFIRRAILPKVAATLRPLRPSDDEIMAVLTDLRRARRRVGTKLRLGDIQHAIGEA